MMNDLFPDFGKPTVKSIEISLQIARGNHKRLECAWGFEYFSLVALIDIKFNHKGADILFHTIPKKIMFDPFIGFGKP
jgi:hypothetical protein